MDQEIKTKWVAALRSGKYTQDRGSLRTKDGYCCLGVLCSVLKAKNWVGDATLPTIVCERSGLPSHNPRVDYLERRTSLSVLNDRIHLSFTQIADIIEEQL